MGAYSRALREGAHDAYPLAHSLGYPYDWVPIADTLCLEEVCACFENVPAAELACSGQPAAPWQLLLLVVEDTLHELYEL